MRNPNISNTSVKFKNKFSESYGEPLTLQAAKNTYDTGGAPQRLSEPASGTKPGHRGVHNYSTNLPAAGQRRTITAYTAFE